MGVILLWVFSASAELAHPGPLSGVFREPSKYHLYHRKCVLREKVPERAPD